MSCTGVKFKNRNDDIVIQEGHLFEYFIVKCIAKGINTLHSIEQEIMTHFHDKVVIDNRVLKYYLFTNFEQSDNDRFILEPFQKEAYSCTQELMEKFKNGYPKTGIQVKSLFESDESTFEDKLIYFLKLLFSDDLKDENIVEAAIYLAIYKKEMYVGIIRNKFEDVLYTFDPIDELTSMLTDEEPKDKFLLDVPINYIFQNKHMQNVLNDLGYNILSDFQKINNENLFLLTFLDLWNIVERVERRDIKTYIELKNKLGAFVESIDEHRKTILIKRVFSVVEGNSVSLQEIGDMLNITRERVRQIEAKFIKKIRFIFEHENFVTFLYNSFKLLDVNDVGYITVEDFKMFINDDELSKFLLVYMYVSEYKHLKVKYDSKNGIIVDKTRDMRKIFSDLESSIPNVISQSDYEKLNSIQKRYIDEEYTLRKSGLYTKRNFSTTEAYLGLLDEYFPNGYSISSKDDFELLLKKYEERYGEKGETSMRLISSYIDRSKRYCLCDRGKYINVDRLPKLSDEFIKKANDHIKKSDIVVYYNDILATFKSELNELGVTNKFMLKGLLDPQLDSDLVTNRDFISNGQQKSLWDAVIEYMHSFKRVFSYDDIMEKFPTVSHPTIYGILSSEAERGLIFLYDKQYIYKENTNLDMFEDRLKMIIKNIVDNCDTDFLTAAKIYAKIELSGETILRDIDFKVDEFNLFSIIKLLLPDDYVYRRPMIIRTNDKFYSGLDALGNYLNGLDSFDEDGVLEYLYKTGLYSGLVDDFQFLCKYMAEEFVEVEEKRAIKKRLLSIDEFDLSKVECVIDSLLERQDEVDLDSFNAYFLFPKITGYEWNKYLLCGLVNSYFTEKFEIYRDNKILKMRRLKHE